MTITMRFKIILLFLVGFSSFLPISLSFAEGTGGVGVILEYLPDKRVHRIRAVFQGSPAAKAQVKPGDEIVTIDGVPAGTLSFEELGKRLRGNPGDVVSLVLHSPSTQENREVKLARVGQQTVSPLIMGAPGSTGMPATLPSTPGSRSIPPQTLTEEEKAKVKAVIARLKTDEERKKMQQLLTELRDGKLVKFDFFQLLKVHFGAN